jgi:phosphonate transport system ATP-binding protein
VASLDIMNGTLVMETLRRITTGAGLTVIGNLRHVEFARRYADRVLELRGGRLVFDGPPTELTEEVLADVFSEVSTDATGLRSIPVGEEIWAIS